MTPENKLGMQQQYVKRSHKGNVPNCVRQRLAESILWHARFLNRFDPEQQVASDILPKRHPPQREPTSFKTKLSSSFNLPSDMFLSYWKQLWEQCADHINQKLRN